MLLTSKETNLLQAWRREGVTRRAGQRMLGVFRATMYLTIYRKARNGIVIDRMSGPRVTRHQQANAGSDWHVPFHTNNTLHAMCSFLTPMTIL